MPNGGPQASICDTDITPRKHASQHLEKSNGFEYEKVRLTSRGLFFPPLWVLPHYYEKSQLLLESRDASLEVPFIHII